MEYTNTQYGKWYLIVPLIIGFLLILDAFLPGQPIPWFAYLIAAAGSGLPILTFNSLTIRDGGDKLIVQFGPIPLIRKTFDYRSITRIEKGRTRFSDGWGIHYSLTGGWVFNVWGFDSVRIWCGNRLYSIGTDDPDGLMAFVENKLQEYQHNKKDSGQSALSP
ncbi:MAG: hypothetical protein ACUVQG_08195 [Thermogutta sp.]